MNFYERRDLTEKVYLMWLWVSRYLLEIYWNVVHFQSPFALRELDFQLFVSSLEALKKLYSVWSERKKVIIFLCEIKMLV